MKGFRKLMVVRRDRMSKKGIQHWSRKLRKRVFRYVFRSQGVKYLPLEMAESRDKFCLWLYDSFGIGYFYVYSWRPSKPRPKPYKLAIIEIRKLDESYTIHYVELTRLLKEHWFEPDRKKKHKNMRKKNV